MKVVCLGFLLACLACSISAQEQGNLLLHRRIPSIELGSRNISEALALLAEKYKVPIANEVSKETTREIATKSARSQLENATVEEILNFLFENRPDYRWQLEDGVIRVSSVSEAEPLFDTVVGEFSVKERTVSEIKMALADHPAVRYVLNENNLEFTELTMLPGGNAKASRKYTFSLDNATVRQVLNRLILQTEGHYWTLVRMGNNKHLWIMVR